MKKALCIALSLAFAAVATADVEFFFTSSSAGYGLTQGPTAIVADPFIPSSFTGFDTYYGYTIAQGGDPNVLAGTDVPAALIAGNPDFIADAVIDPGAGEFVYLWVHFDETEADNTKINGINGLFMAGASATSYYYCNTAGFRWDGALDAAALSQNPQSLVAVTSAGILNTTANSAQNMYYGGGKNSAGAGFRTALLGAVAYDTVGSYAGTLTEVSTSTAGTAQTWKFLNGVQVVPEPASLLLIGLAGLVLRRR